MNGANVFLCKGRVELRTNFYFGSKKSARKSNCIKPIKLSLVPGRITEQFSFWLEKSGWKIKLHQTGNKNKMELIRSHFNERKCKRQSHMGNLSGEILFSHDRVTVTLLCSALTSGQIEGAGVAQVLKEEILLTSWHLMAVVRKGKISPVHAVASNRSQWKRQCKWWNFALFFTFETLSSILGVTFFNCWQLWQRVPLIFRDLEKLVCPTEAHRRLWYFFFTILKFLKIHKWGVLSEKKVCWQIQSLE